MVKNLKYILWYSRGKQPVFAMSGTYLKQPYVITLKMSSKVCKEKRTLTEFF